MTSSKKYTILIFWYFFALSGCGQSPGSSQSANQISASVNLGSGTAANPVAMGSLSNAKLNVSTTCGTYTFINTINVGDNILLASGMNCSVSLVSFQLADTGETFTATTQSSLGISSVVGVYTGNKGTPLLIVTPTLKGSLNPVSQGIELSFAYSTTNSVTATIESNNTYFGVVSGQTGTLAITFSTNTGTASNLSITTTNLPTGMSVQNNQNFCNSISTGSSSCVLTLTYTPTSIMSASSNLVVPFTYISADGASMSSSVTFSYQALNRVKWIYYTYSNPGNTSLSTDESLVYFPAGTTSGSYGIYAVNASTGNLAWSNTSAQASSAGPVQSADGTSLYVYGPNSGTIYALSSTTGTTKWSSATCGGWFAPIVNPANSIVMGLCGSTLKAFNTISGAAYGGWTNAINFGGAYSGAISPDGNKYYAGSGASRVLYALNVSTGGTSCSYTAGGNLEGRPAVSPNSTSIYFASTDSKLYAINSSCVNQWTTAASYAAGGYAEVLLDTSGTKLYYVTLTGGVYSLLASNGSQIYQAAANLGTYTRPGLSKDGKTLYAGSSSGYLYAINTSDGSTKWSHYIGSGLSTPSISSNGNTIYFAQSGSILAINESVIKY